MASLAPLQLGREEKGVKDLPSGRSGRLLGIAEINVHDPETPSGSGIDCGRVRAGRGRNGGWHPEMAPNENNGVLH